MNNIEKLCRFCLIHVKDTYFDDLEEPCDILSALNLKVNMEISEEPVICVDCIENLRKLFNFKVNCVQNEGLLIPFINSHVNKKIDLQQVYLEINGSMSLSDKKVCRFCMCETPINLSQELNAIIEFMLPAMYLLEFFPELDINLVRDSIICKTCHNLLQDHLTFTKKYMNVEESIHKYVKAEGTDAEGKIDLKGVKQFMDRVIIKKEIEDGDTFKNEIQYDEIVEDEDMKMGSYIKIEDCHLEIKSESIDVKPIVDNPESNLNVVSEESGENYNEHFVTHKGIKYSAVTLRKCGVEGCLFETKRKCDLIRHRLIHQDPSEVTMYKCKNEGCSYETKHKSNLIRHKLVHKNVSEVMMYKCGFDGCLYETKHKNVLTRHKLIHKDLSEVTMYKCKAEDCSFKTKHKKNLLRHKLIHKDISEVMMYTCGFEGCLYKTKHRNCLIKHMLIHKNPSEVIMYKCKAEGCSYENKLRCQLTRHSLIHKDVSEVMMYKCAFEGCLYETKHKSCLNSHALIHKDPSEVTMYKCGFEGCLYETKHKNSLGNHMLVHKGPSEVTMYKCGIEDCPYETKYKSNLGQYKLIHKDVSQVMM